MCPGEKKNSTLNVEYPRGECSDPFRFGWSFPRFDSRTVVLVGDPGAWRGLVAVLPEAAVGVEVVGLGALALDAGSVHVPRAGDLVLRVTPAAQAGLEAVLELFADKVEDNWIYAGVYSG